jgi:uncharacterized protein
MKTMSIRGVIQHEYYPLFRLFPRGFRGKMTRKAPFGDQTMPNSVPDNLIRILICPKCRHPVTAEEDRVVCTNAECGLRYPVIDGIPAMLIEDAEPPSRATEPSP